MDAVGVAIGMFACWTFVGFALTNTLLPRRRSVSNLLLAPAVGMATMELAGHASLRLGTPIGQSAHYMLGGALLVSALLLAFRRPVLPFRRILPFAVILTVTFLLVGWPLFRWGGDWIANANDDMAHYTLAATGYKEHGYRSFPAARYLAGEDLSFTIWSLYADCVGHRHGSEMSLALASTISGMPTPFVFMPVILAMHLVLVSSVGFMLYRLADGRTTALIGCSLMAISPLSTYAVVQQLLGQVGGLALLAATTGYFTRPAHALPASGWLRRGVLGGLLAGGTMLHYTECVPFLLAAFGFHVVLGFAWGRRDFKQITIAILAACMVPLLLGRFSVGNFGYLLEQLCLGRSADPGLAAVFPQYLNSEGLARLLGFTTLSEPVVVAPGSPWPIHRLVLAGACFVTLSVVAGVGLAWRRRAVGEMVIVMAAVGILLLRGPAPYGLFKLAMYAQPFIIGSFALGWTRLKPGPVKWAGLACLLVLVPLQYSTQKKNVSWSVSGPGAGGCTPGATQQHLVRQYYNASRGSGANRLFLPVNDRVSWMLFAACCPGKTTCVPHAIPALAGAFSGNLGENFIGLDTELVPPEGMNLYRQMKGAGFIQMHDPANPATRSELGWDTPDWLDQPSPGDYLIEPPELFSVFNRFHRAAEEKLCRALPLTEAKNFIFWRQSTLSRTFMFHLEDPGALWDIQGDPAYSQQTMAASGRYLTFQVLHPSDKVRLLIDGTASYIRGDQSVPNIAVVGDKRVALPVLGQGAARIVSEAIPVQRVGKRSFVVLDLGPAAPPPPPEHPLAWDRRQISFYLRDVSLLSEGDYSALNPPKSVEKFPGDLRDRQLEFSGCEEGGNVGKHSWFRLTRPDAASPLAIKGKVLRTLSGQLEPNDLTLKWNGVVLERKTITTDEFEFRFSGLSGMGPGKVELEFSGAQCIPPSVRDVSAQLQFLGFE